MMGDEKDLFEPGSESDSFDGADEPAAGAGSVGGDVLDSRAGSKAYGALGSGSGNILSQEELAALRDEVGSREPRPESVDLSGGERTFRLFAAALQPRLHAFSDGLGGVLLPSLGTPQVDRSPHDDIEVPAEATRRLKSSGLIIALHLPGDDVSTSPPVAYLALDRQSCFSMLERTFGGELEDDLVDDPALADRDYVTRAERSFLEDTVERIVELASRLLLGEAKQAPFERQAIENPNLVSIEPSLQACLVWTVDVAYAGRKGMVLLVVTPPLLKRALGERWTPPVVSKQALSRTLLDIPVEVVTHLGSAQVPAGVVARLQPGQIVRLDAKQREPVVVLVGGKKKFLGRPEFVNDTLSVCIERELA